MRADDGVAVDSGGIGIGGYSLGGGRAVRGAVGKANPI
jgi:hypothetical protein